MTYPLIVVHLDAGPRCAARVALAARLAQGGAGRLLGIAPTGLPDMIVSMSSAVPDAIELIALSAATLRENAEEAAAAFEQHCRGAGLPSFEARIVVDDAVEALVHHGRCSDLIVTGQTDLALPVAGVPADLPQQVLLHAGSPVLVVPCTGSIGAIGRRILVAWKNTREAARALRDALPLLRQAEHVSLVEVGAVPLEASPDDSLLAASAWLAAHGVAFEAHREIELAGVGDQLLTRAGEIGADLIVSGGYGHSRLREWALGGVTRHLLGHMTLPTLFSH